MLIPSFHRLPLTPSTEPYTYPVPPASEYTDTLPALAGAAGDHRMYAESRSVFSRHPWRKSMPDRSFFSF